jgi:RNA polymerase sigma-70 factor, ECF subfamily
MPSKLHALPDPPHDLSPNDDHAVQLLFLIGSGDHFAFETLYQLWSPILLGIAFRMLGNRSEAEEAMQDSFVKIWHRAADYDPKKSKPFVWSFTLLRSICIDRLRFGSRRKRANQQISSICETDFAEPISNDLILSRDTMQAVRKAMDALPLDECRCLELAVFLEYTHSEISEQLGTPLGTVKNRLRRALEKLKKSLADYEI